MAVLISAETIGLSFGSPSPMFLVECIHDSWISDYRHRLFRSVFCPRHSPLQISLLFANWRIWNCLFYFLIGHRYESCPNIQNQSNTNLSWHDGLIFNWFSSAVKKIMVFCIQQTNPMSFPKFDTFFRASDHIIDHFFGVYVFYILTVPGTPEYRNSELFGSYNQFSPTQYSLPAWPDLRCSKSYEQPVPLISSPKKKAFCLMVV